MLENIPDFDELFSPSKKTSKEVQAMLDEYLLDEEGAEENSSEVLKYSKEGDDASNVDSAFAELLGT